MTQFWPPISDRETAELIEIANCTDENIWRREATLQAKKELIKRNISQAQQDEIIEAWYEELEEYFKKEAQRLKNNKTESYTILEMILIFVAGPIMFFKSLDDIFTLRKENYYLKFKQRIIILTLGSIAWFIFIYASIHSYQQRRLEEIEKIDISDWKKKHGYD